MLLPLAGAASPQQSDIKKPTRERVKANDKKGESGKKQADDKKKPVDDKKKQADDKKKPVDDKTKTTDEAKTQPAVKESQTVKAPADGEKKEQAAPAPPALTPESVVYNGIDVSRHQGKINWETIKKNPKVQYVYIKATEGSDLIDDCYRYNIREARKAGLKVGSYHYLSNKSSATTQFRNFATTAVREEQDLIPVIDVEVCKQWTPQQLRDSLMLFAKMVEDYYGCKPIIYTYETFYRSYLGKAFAHYPIFIAKYPKTPNEKPNIEGAKWVMWQFSEKGRIPGINGCVDLSRFNTGRSLNDILYRPAKGKPKVSVKDAVDRNKPKPSTVTMKEESQAKEGTSSSAKPKEQTETKPAKVNSGKSSANDEVAKKRKAEEEKKRKAEEEKKRKAEAEKKAKAEAEKKAKAEAEKKAKAEAEKKRKAEADAKAKRKAEAKVHRQNRANQRSSGKSSTSASLYGGASSKMAQSQRNDSIRSAKSVGRKTNKSSADND